jgi:CRP-like cAMP-binding protein
MTASIESRDTLPPSAREPVAGEGRLMQQLTAEERTKLFSCAQERRFKNGQLIFQKGDEGGSMMAVVEGRVRISIASEEGREIVLSMIEPGGVFGEIALLDGRGRTADAYAMGNCRLLVLYLRDLMPMLEQEPKLAVRLLQILCERVRHANGICESVVFLDLPARLARLLLQLDTTHGQAVPGGRRIGIRLAQAEIGNLVAASRETVNKQLKQWEAEGVLALDHGHIVLKDRATLEDLVPDTE